MADDRRPPMLARAGEENSLYTGAASTCLRAMALAVIAVAWLFLHDGNNTAKQTLHDARHHHALIWALTLSVAALTLDTFQYASGALLSQFNENLLEQVFRDPVRQKSNWRTGFAWWRAERTGLVDEFLADTKTHNGQTRSDRKKAKAKVQQIIADHWAFKRGASTAGSYGADLEKRVTAYLAGVRPGTGVVAITRTLFWLKTGVTIAAGVSLFIFCGNDLIG